MVDKRGLPPEQQQQWTRRVECASNGFQAGRFSVSFDVLSVRDLLQDAKRPGTRLPQLRATRKHSAVAHCVCWSRYNNLLFFRTETICLCLHHGLLLSRSPSTPREMVWRKRTSKTAPIACTTTSFKTPVSDDSCLKLFQLQILSKLLSINIIIRPSSLLKFAHFVVKLFRPE